MLVIIYPTGTKRSIHLNHFIVEAEKADPDCRVITTDEFVKTHLDTWPSDTVFIIRVGSHYINDILPTLTKIWHDGKYTVFPNVPAIKNCVRKSYGSWTSVNSENWLRISSSVCPQRSTSHC